jgi:hypothetical protein
MLGHELEVLDSYRGRGTIIVFEVFDTYFGPSTQILVLWRICSEQEPWSQRNSRCQRTALKQNSFLGDDRETDNGTTSVTRQQVLNKQE